MNKSFLSLLLVAAATTPVTNAKSLRGRHAPTSSCLRMRNLDNSDDNDNAMNALQWHRQEGLHNGFPYYYNAEKELYVYMTRPVPHTPQLYYTINADLHDTSLLQYGYCTQAFMDIFDCDARWMGTNNEIQLEARFEPCSDSDTQIA